MCTDQLKDPTKRFNYPNGAQAVYSIAKNEGIKSLYRGVGPNIIRSVLMNVSQLAVYDSLKRTLVTERGVKDSLPLHFLLGGVAGTIATTACARE